MIVIRAPSTHFNVNVMGWMWIRLQQCVGAEAQQCRKFGSHLNTLVDVHALKQIQGPKQSGEVGNPPPPPPAPRRVGERLWWEQGL